MWLSTRMCVRKGRLAAQPDGLASESQSTTPFRGSMPHGLNWDGTFNVAKCGGQPITSLGNLSGERAVQSTRNSCVLTSFWMS